MCGVYVAPEEYPLVCYELCVSDSDCTMSGTTCSIEIGLHDEEPCRGLYHDTYRLCTLP
jgi:hypothetical protein